MKRSFKIWLFGFAAVLVLLSMAAATYAWFTSNRQVETGLASARTGEENLELQISSSGGSSFQSMEPAPIVQVNRTDAGELLPVSTADLQQFVYAPVTVSGMAASFQLVEDETRYYHGRIYLRAVGDGLPAGSRMNLYLDQSEGLLARNDGGMMLNAARLGLVFEEDASSRVILRLSETENPGSSQVDNTMLNGQLLSRGQVLACQNGTVQAAADPSEPVTAYTVSFGNGQISVPDKALLSMEPGRIYSLDLYFYLEGCDPDCSDAVEFQAADLNLAFYGLLSEGAGR